MRGDAGGRLVKITNLGGLLRGGRQTPAPSVPAPGTLDPQTFDHSCLTEALWAKFSSSFSAQFSRQLLNLEPFTKATALEQYSHWGLKRAVIFSRSRSWTENDVEIFVADGTAISSSV